MVGIFVPVRKQGNDAEVPMSHNPAQPQSGNIFLQTDTYDGASFRLFAAILSLTREDRGLGHG